MQKGNKLRKIILKLKGKEVLASLKIHSLDSPGIPPTMRGTGLSLFGSICFQIRTEHPLPPKNSPPFEHVARCTGWLQIILTVLTSPQFKRDYVIDTVCFHSAILRNVQAAELIFRPL